MSVDKLGDRSLGVRIDSDGTTLLQQFTLDGPGYWRTYLPMAH
ncbi:hypothetical protein [Streptomyces griseoluteus]